MNIIIKNCNYNKIALLEWRYLGCMRCKNTQSSSVVVLLVLFVVAVDRKEIDKLLF